MSVCVCVCLCTRWRHGGRHLYFIFSFNSFYSLISLSSFLFTSIYLFNHDLVLFSLILILYLLYLILTCFYFNPDLVFFFPFYLISFIYFIFTPYVVANSNCSDFIDLKGRRLSHFAKTITCYAMLGFGYHLAQNVQKRSIIKSLEKSCCDCELSAAKLLIFQFYTFCFLKSWSIFNGSVTITLLKMFRVRKFRLLLKTAASTDHAVKIHSLERRRWQRLEQRFPTALGSG